MRPDPAVLESRLGAEALNQGLDIENRTVLELTLELRDMPDGLGPFERKYQYMFYEGEWLDLGAMTNALAEAEVYARLGLDPPDV